MKLNGWLSIYKQQNISSSKIVLMLKQIFNIKKIGHTGTLDIGATGILPIAVGETTKLIQFIIKNYKHYIFTIKFGEQTHTGDHCSTVLKYNNYMPTSSLCHKICKLFTGVIIQTPHQFSAIKIQGIRAYKLANRNTCFHIPTRKITIFNLICIKHNYKNKLVTFYTQCSKGTYIRSLSESISKQLNTLGYTINICRTQNNTLTKSNAINTHTITKKNKNIIYNNILPTYTLIQHITNIKVNNKIAKQIFLGQKIKFKQYKNINQVWINYKNQVLSIGKIKNNIFTPNRVLKINF